MSYRCIIAALFLFAFNALPLVTVAQENKVKNIDKEFSGDQLFNDNEVLHFTLTGNLTALFKDRGDNPSYHPLLLTYLSKDSIPVSINLKSKTRGHFRKDRRNCKMPPLLLNFLKGEETSHTLFEHQNKLKLVVPCQGDDYVIEEWLVYKVYNLISAESFRARLALVDFQDSLNKKKSETHYCFLLEDEKEMAERNQSFVFKKKMLDMKGTNLQEFEKMAVFQYLIGNTDWSVPFLQNIVLITRDSLMAPTTVPYDFDHAGIVDASYAAPAPELEIPSILVRLYRGFCEDDLKNLDPVFELFNRLKPEIYKVYDSCSLLSPKYIKFVNRFLDDFYKTINNKRSIENEFGMPCRTTRRVEIKGLKK